MQLVLNLDLNLNELADRKRNAPPPAAKVCDRNTTGTADLCGLSV